MDAEHLRPNDLDSETLQLLSRREVRATLARLGLRASRRLGQNFLVEPVVLSHILRAATFDPQDIILEVGPGLGVLTAELLRRARRVVAVELDRRLAAWLRERFSHLSHFTLVEGDILQEDIGSLMGQSPYHVVANLPYAVTSPVLRRLLEARPAPTRIVVMVQWEVAQRITAVPPEMSLLALAVQFYACPEIVTKVSAGCFFPVPKVDSAVLHLEVSPRPRIPVAAEAFFGLAKLGFAHPRQQLAKSLSRGLGRPRKEIDALMIAAGVDPRRRPEAVSLEEWAALWNVLFAEKGA